MSGKKSKLPFIIVSSLVAVIAIAGFILYQQYTNRVYRACYAEAGTEVTARDFLKDETKEAFFTEDSPAITNNIPGTYHAFVKSGIFTYDCTITIEDTIAPTAEPLKMYSEYGADISPEKLVTNITDATSVTVEYVDKPDFKQYGRQNIPVILTDAGGNTTEYEATVIIRSTVEELTMEVGGTLPELKDFLLTDNTQAKMVTPLNEINTDEIKDHEIEIEADDMVYTTILHIVDTIPPVMQVKNVDAYTTEKLCAEDFVVSAEDATALSYSFEKEPDMTKTGTQDVTICAEDAGGNVTEQQAVLTLKADEEAPVIKANDIYVYLGNSISYRKNASVTDNCDRNIELEINAKQVNVNVEGNYKVIYTAKDRAGNVSSKEIQVFVKQRTYDRAEIDALCDMVLAQIIRDGMSQYDKILAIYQWIRGNVQYTNHSDKNNWLQGAYEGLALHKGDCFVYFSTAKALLTRAGIKNADISKIPAKTQHFWNVVDIGEGWRHFDTCPRKDKSTFFYVTDEELLAYSNTHNLSHNYDKSIYTFFETPQPDASENQADTTVPADTVTPEDTTVPADTVAPADTTVPADTVAPADTTVPVDITTPADIAVETDTMASTGADVSAIP